MENHTTSHSFAPLFVTNFFGVINDNFLKTLASFVVLGWIANETLQSVFMGATAAALVLPYILCSPLADRLTVIFPKRRILTLAKWAEIPIVTLAIAGFICHSAILVVTSVLLMGLQSSLYSPAKYALVRDIGGYDRISTGMGGMEGIAFFAMLGGTVAASFAVDHASPIFHYAALIAFALLGLLASLTIRADETPNRAIHAINPLRYMRRCFRVARLYPGLNAVIITLSVFWLVAAMLQMGLLVYGKQVLALDATRTGLILSVAAIGIVAGQIIAGFVDRRHFLLGATLLTGWIAATLLFVLFFAPLDPITFAMLVGLLSFDLGFFKLPLDAEIQKVVKGPRLNTILAYFNQVSFLFMFGASALYMATSAAFGPRAFLLILAIALLVTPVWFVGQYRSALLFTGHWIFTRRYAITTTFAPAQNCAALLASPRAKQQTPPFPFHALLVLPNHPAMVDPMLVVATLRHTPVAPLCDELYYDRGGIASTILRRLDAVRVPDLRKHRTAGGAAVARGLTDVVTQALVNGRNVVFYPSGHIWSEPNPHEEIGTRQLAYNVCRALKDHPENIRVIGIRTSGLWGSIWSRKGRTKSPAFGPTLAKSILLWFVCLVTRRRRAVTMHFEDLTDRTRAWSDLSRLEFNRQLEAWYNHS